MVSSPTMTEGKSEKNQVYELGYHILPTVVSDEVENVVGTIRSAIERRGGIFISEGPTETIALAYPMFVNNGGKQTMYESAYFGWMKFELNPDEAVLLRDEDLANNTHILRFTLFKTTREETRAQLQTEKHTILREVETTGTIEKKEVQEEGGEVSEEALDKSIDELTET